MSRFGVEPTRLNLFGQSWPKFLGTEEDRGLVAVPMISPNLDVRVPRGEGGEATLLVSETTNALLFGQRYVDMLPLIDGVRTRQEIVDLLAEKHQPIAVQTSLVTLATKGYLVSAEFDMDRDTAAFWCSLGVTPRWAEKRLRSARVVVAGDDGRLSERLREMGLSVTDAEPTLAVIVTTDYLAEAHAETNLRHLASGVPWTLVKSVGVAPLFGPVFRPAHAGPCWACLAHRLRSNLEVENYLRTAVGSDAGLVPRACSRTYSNAITGIAAMEIAKWVVLSELAPLHERVIGASVFTPAGDAHPVMRRPQCSVCGDEALHRLDRAVSPVRLRSSPKPIKNSGGLRSVPPEETVRKYRHLVSPISGVVTQLMRVTDEDDPWLHVYWAGSNLALKSDQLYLLRNSLRTKSSGKGSTREQAEASALCEALERYSGVYHGDEIRRRARFSDFADGEALHPNALMLYSDRQYENAEELNARRSRFNFVPVRFDPDVRMDWSPVWSLTADRHRYLPTSMLYFAAPHPNGTVYCGPDSNGCAAGNTLEESILQGFFELVERDAFACWWYNRIAFPEVDLESFEDAYLAHARDYYASINRSVWLIDVTNDLNVPVFVAVSHRTDKEEEDILFSAGAHLDPHVAALRAMCELNQYLGGVKDVAADGTGYLWDDPECIWWWKTARLADNLWLAPASGVKRRRRQDYSVPETNDILEDVEFCRALVEGKGLEFLVLNQTRPDIGMPVAKTIVPGLRHFWARFAPGRLYDVPVKLGWLDAPTDETDLNPVAVFI